MKPSQPHFPRRALGASMLAGAVVLSLSLGGLAVAGSPGAVDRDNAPRQACRDLTGEVRAACREGMQATRAERREQYLTAAEGKPGERSWREDRRAESRQDKAEAPRMTDEERQAFRAQREERRAAWEAMSPEERQSMRDNMRSMREQMRSLDPQERLELRERLRDMTPDERRAWFERQRG
ncbi:hypothetical protein [Ectothiorhodospira lacustris]|uniref:hypothetical protein n=1 Tax=Ectothiorhodospira lacustris TaxID=2899127 RepID=UPI001EE865A5|nr:hypothetical protein [Ectothiorhodospira lacustris]MCG5510941.1 hypothetical protein [Ectothiorhodospira lacustris]MCG5522673.1 hypothetical protein [Ectothiorhodospira lacustris]